MRELLERGLQAWLRFWFEVDDTRPLELCRIGLGATLFILYAGQLGHVTELYTDRGWVPLADLAQWREGRYGTSVLYYFTEPPLVRGLWLVTVAACAALTVGWRTSWVKWIVWIGHLSFLNRNPGVVYGVDDICSNLLLLLCLAPVGRALSLDARRYASRPDTSPTVTALRHGRASATLRLIQIQMAIVFFFAGIGKLKGADWWDGDAIWYVLIDYEFSVAPLGPFAHNMWFVNALTYGTVLIELAYAFLIWDPRLRPVLLALAVALHVGTAAMMGLVLFAFAMIAGHLAFTPSAWIDRLRRGG